MHQFLLSIIIFSPLLFVPLILMVPKAYYRVHKFIAILAFSFQLVFSLELLHSYGAKKLLIESAEWIRFTNASGEILLAVDYILKVDGLNILFIPLTAFIMLIGVVISTSGSIKKYTQGYFSLILLLGSSIMGCFLAMDFFLFYLFFELMLFPMYFLIGIWGGERKEYAAIKFFLYTLVGSIFILVGMIALYSAVINPEATMEATKLASVEAVQNALKSGSIATENIVQTFQFEHMADFGNYLPESWLHPESTQELFGFSIRNLIFLSLLIGFAIKLPVVPVHTWLPDAHVEAPTPISVILAGLLLKVGGYGILRIAYPIFPDAALYFAEFLAILGLVAIIYASLIALGTHNLKKMIAYSSVAHMGFVLLGIAALTNEGINGAIFQMISHGIISPMLFIVAGVLYARTHNLEIENYRGLAQRLPIYTGFTTIAFFASLGLPGFSGFVGELLVFLGAFKSTTISGWIAVVATLGLVLGASYYLWTLQRMFLGDFSLKYNDWKDQLKDLSILEKVVLASLAVFTLLFGVFPSLLLDFTSPFTEGFVKNIFDSFNSINP